MRLKNKKIKSFSCVFCAVLIGLLTVFSAIGFSPKKEKISASAEEVSLPSEQYYLYLPAGYRFEAERTSNTYELFTLFNTFGFFRTSCKVGTSTLKRHLTFVVSVFRALTFDGISDSDLDSSFFLYLYGDLDLYVAFDTFIPVNLSFFNFYLELNNLEFNGDFIDLPLLLTDCSFYIYDCNGGVSSYVYKLTDVLRIYRGGSILSEELQAKYDEGYEAGYEQGEKDFYPYGYADGYSKGLDEGYDYGCEESAGALFDTCEMDIDNLDDNRDNLDNEKLSFQRINAGTYEQSPLYLLSIDNSGNDFKVGTRYEIEIKFSPYVDYSTGSKFPRVDELYISAGKYGLTSSFGDPSERLSNLHSEVYTYGKGNGKEFTCGLDSPSLVVEDSVFGTFKAVKYGDDLNVGDEDNLYMKTLRFEFVYDDEQVAVFTTQNLVNSYMTAYNYTYAIAESAGNANGYKSGYTDGYETGHTTGYTTGSAEGLQNAELGSFMNLITAVIDAPVKSMLGLLDFEILGMDMQKFFLSLLSAALIIAAYRLFSGGA